jgi:hypothetical protein
MSLPHLVNGADSTTYQGLCQSSVIWDEFGKNLDAAHWVGAITRDAEGSHMQLQARS